VTVLPTREAAVVPAPRADTAPRSMTLLGATGSVGRSTVDLLLADPARYRVETVVGGRDVAALARTAVTLGARFAVLADPESYAALSDALAGTGVEVAAGADAVVEAASRPVDWTLAAISGTAGLPSALAAIRRGGHLAIANKECFVCAGVPFMREAARHGATILPVDSEHNAVFQALAGGRRQDVEKVVLTASGGPFRNWSRAQMETAGIADALRHPTWSMGRKITIDSATLMNKGLELIEAHHLFGLPPAQLDVLVHPQSVVHGLVHWRDGSVLAGLAATDMRILISYCLGWPERIETQCAKLDLAKVGTLSFETPDFERFPALRIARDALEVGGGSPAVLNAANEIAVEAFLQGRIGFMEIVNLVESTLIQADRLGMLRTPASVEDAMVLDREARALAGRQLASA